MPLPRDEFRVEVWERAITIQPSGSASATLDKVGECWMGVSQRGSTYNRWDPGLEAMYDYTFVLRNRRANKPVLSILSSHLTLPENLYFHVNDERFETHQNFVVKVERKVMATCMRHHRDYHEVFFGNIAQPVPREIELDGSDVEAVP